MPPRVEVCRARSSSWAPTSPPRRSQSRCRRAPWGPREKRQVRSPLAECWREQQCLGASVQRALRSVTAFSVTYPPHLRPGLPPGFAMWPQQNAAAGTKGEAGGCGGSGPRGEAMPSGGHRGELWLCSGLPAPVGGGAGGTSTGAERRWEGKGAFYKFLNFMTVLHQWNVHSICWDVSTENMHWAY